MLGASANIIAVDLRLEGGMPADEGTSLSLALFKRRPGAPRLAEDMLGRNGELSRVSNGLSFGTSSVNEPHGII